MSMNKYFLVTWLVLAGALFALAMYRKLLARGEDDSLHMRETDLPLIGQQMALAHRLDTIDHWGKIFTVFVVLLGIAVAAVYLYVGWQQGLTIPS